MDYAEGGKGAMNIGASSSPSLLLPFFFLSPDEGVCGDPLRIFETGYRDLSFSPQLCSYLGGPRGDSVSRLRRM